SNTNTKQTEDIMLKNFMMVGLLSLSTIVLFRIEANARVCLLSQGESCLFYSGSAECDIVADQIGSLHKHPAIDCHIRNQHNGAPNPGLIACANPGKKGHTAPGIQVVPVDAPEGFGSSVDIHRSDVKHGVVTLDFFATLSGSPLRNL